MHLTSPVFKDHQQVPSRYTCDGEGARVPLEISDAPTSTHSFALIVDDLDAKDAGWNFLHWIVWNIHPHTTIIGEHKPLPGAVEGRTSFGTYHWGGPCPPKGSHRYRFRLFALDKSIDLDRDSTAGDLEAEMNGHILEQAELTGTYHRE